MNSRRSVVPFLGLCALLAGAVGWALWTRAPLFVPQMVPTKSVALPVERAAYNPLLVHQNLQFFAQKSAGDKQDPISRAILAHWYLESYRETGDNADAVRAEQAARASLAIRTRNNAAAFLELSHALLTQHRFAEALVAARRAAIANSEALRQCANLQYEIGDYQAAEKDLARAAPPKIDPGYDALTARFKELHGDSSGQIALLQRAVKTAEQNPDASLASLAYFHERLGRALAMAGRLDEAQQSYLQGLKFFPRDFRTMAALAHLHAAKNDWKKSLEWGEKAAQIVPSPDTLALLGDAYQQMGEAQKAAQKFRLVEQIGALSSAQGVLYDRQRALYYADHNLKPDEAVKLARGELSLRRDIYAFDTLAWALFKAGKTAEAAKYAAQATAFGTRDASLWFHAGMIAAAQNQTARAQTYLKRALEINPFFHPTQPAEARATLARLGTTQK